jgi:hypothetical protein
MPDQELLVGRWNDTRPAMSAQDGHAHLRAVHRQRIKDRAVLVPHGEQLAGLFTLQLHTKRGKPLDRRTNGKRSENVPHHMG